MIWVLLAALAGGTSVVLQAQSARAEGHPGHLGLLATLVRRPRYVAGLACMFVGFLSGAMALRHLPLFAVQAGRSSSLAVTAVLAVFLLRARLRGRDILAIAAVAVGLVAVTLASHGGRGHVHLFGPARLAPLAVVLVLLALGQWASTRTWPFVGPVVGVAGGLAFTVIGLCLRGVGGARMLDLGAVLRDPLTWTIPVAGLVGLHLTTVALTKASVVSVTSAVIASETVAAAVLGFALAGDRTRHGLGWLALTGVVLVLVGALDLTRFSGDLEDAVAE